jgi:anti-sigma regulatory factor (Ser/Thr protein kinase)
MTGSTDLHVVLAGGEKAAGHARRVLGERLSALLPDDVLGDLQLLVTEIIANSVRHGGVGEDGEIDLRVSVDDRIVRVEMRDTGRQADPRVRTPDLGGGGGFGMVLVSRMSARWGVDHEPNVVMWFELALSAARASEAAIAEPARPEHGRRRGRGPLHYSLALNSQIAMPSITSPSASTTNASSSAGTCQPHQVTPGSSLARAAALMSRWLNTSRRIGSTA